MPHIIGLNHIFDDGIICFCLVCRDSLAEKYPSDRDDAICQHLRSEGHEINVLNLFKVCVPDPKCESRNIRYLDIVINSEFDVWEQGIEPSYVSKKNNHFVCLICKYEVSKCCNNTNKIKDNLQCHLESEMHKDNVKNTIWWTYHPNLDSNYIALNTIFMYCSFCQERFESKENSLLEFAADHIQTELKKTNSNNVSNIKLNAVNSDSALITELNNTELVEVNTNDESKLLHTIPVSASITELKNSELVGVNSNYESKLPQTIPDSASITELKNSELVGVNSNDESKLPQTNSNIASITELNHLNTELVEVNSNDKSKLLQTIPDIASVTELKTLELVGVNSNDESKLLQTIPDSALITELKNSELVGVNSKLLKSNSDTASKTELQEKNSNDVSIKSQVNEEVVICSTCSEEIEVLNENIPFSVLKHSQKHKDLSFDDIEPKIKGKANVECDFCHEQIEIFNNDQVLSYNYHCDNNHPGNRNSLVKIENASFDFTNDHKYFEGPDIIAKAVSLLPQDLRDHLNFVGIEEKKLYCTLCNYEFYFSNDINTACEVLQNHFSEFYHKSQYEDCAQKYDDDVEDEEELKENSQVFKDLQFNRSAINKAGNAGTVVTNITLEQYNTCNRTRYEPKVQVRSRFEVLNILFTLFNASPLVHENKHILDEKEGNFHCQLCDETLRCTRRGSELVKHLLGESHLVKSRQRFNGTVRTRDKVLRILNTLSKHNAVVNQNLEDIGEKDGHFFCECCNEVITCTLSGRHLLDHLKGECHLVKSRKKRFNGTVRTRAKVLGILNTLPLHNAFINKNLEDIGEKDGHFFCERCNEVIMCTLSGKKLLDHLTGLNHELQMKKLSEEQRKLRRKSEPSKHVYSILEQLTNETKIVSDNIKILGEKQGHFYCEVCDAVLLCTSSGNKLIEHLKNDKHNVNYLRHVNLL